MARWIMAIAGCVVLAMSAMLIGQERPGRRGFRGMASISEGQPQAASEKEARILAVLGRLEASRAGMMNVPMRDGRLLRILAESISARQVVEIGTSNGYSGLWLCLALTATSGRLTTFEIDPTRAALARENFKAAGVDAMVSLIEGDAHQTLSQSVTGPVDLVFIDADKPGYLDYLQKVLPKVRPGGLIIGHNVTEGMVDPGYLKAITSDPSLETVLLPQDTSGISITLKKRLVDPNSR
ncbi:MAG: O-methyltransferase [Sedimentisphaerales bacterium]|nr:O-methyltransferase [Sedimentisphaerales bacterium]